jgi:hypothetical protein
VVPGPIVALCRHVSAAVTVTRNYQSVTASLCGASTRRARLGRDCGSWPPRGGRVDATMHIGDPTNAHCRVINLPTMGSIAVVGVTRHLGARFLDMEGGWDSSPLRSTTAAGVGPSGYESRQSPPPES